MPETLIDLRSDTATRPTPGMREAIATAEVGDDMVGEDPTVNELEALAAEMFGREAAVFACSGTQSNQMGVRCHCQPGDEILINETGHIGICEAGGPAVLSGATVRPIPAPHGKLDVEHLQGKIRACDQHLVRTRLVCLENTTNAGGGRVYDLDQIERVGAWARDNDLKTHLDGARLFNACIAGDYSPADLARNVDTVSICFSKGLGCPMGSMLVGSDEDIWQARRTRKLFGGALRQAGMMAAAALYALEHHVTRLADDHANAAFLAAELANIDGISINPDDVESNLVFFRIDAELGTPIQFATRLQELGVRVGPSGGGRVRACTHLDVSREDIVTTVEYMRQCVNEGFKEVDAVVSGPYAR